MHAAYSREHDVVSLYTKGSTQGAENCSFTCGEVTVNVQVDDDVKKSIAIRHYMKNGFHVDLDDDCSAKRKLSKVNSTPPKLGRSPQETDNKNTDKVESQFQLLSVEAAHRRASSLKVYQNSTSS